MPAPFSPVHIPFISGARQDLGNLAQESPAQLRRAVNVAFTKRGHIVGRPGVVSQDEQVQIGGASGVLEAGLGDVISADIPSGIVATGHANGVDSGGDTPLACWQGRAFFKRRGPLPPFGQAHSGWTLAGSHWSLRQTKSAVLGTYDPVFSAKATQVPVGRTVVATVSSAGGTSGFPILNDAGEITGVSLGTLANFANAKEISVADNAIFFIEDATGNVFAQIPPSAPFGDLPAATQFLVGTNGATAPSVAGITALSAVDGFYYVAFKSTVFGRIDVVKVNPGTGAVVQTLSITGLGDVRGASLVHNENNRLGLVWHDIAAVLIKTKVILINGITGVMSDSGLDLALTGTPLFFLFPDHGNFLSGLTHNGLMSVLFTTDSGDLYVGGRSFTAATETAVTHLVANGLGQEKEWDPLFAGVRVAGHTFVGVLNSVDVFNQSSQWLVLDMTALYGEANTTNRSVVAAGPYLGAARVVPSSVFKTETSVAFSIAEGITFSTSARAVPIIQRAAIRRITLSLQATQAAHVNGVTLLSGQLLHVFDGTAVRPDHFAEEAPFIFSTTAASGAGSLPAGSFTYQATWETVNSRGQTIRSGASNQLTMTVTLNQKVTVIIARPQLHSVPSQADAVRIRLWATRVNPTNNSPLFFVGEFVDSSPATGTPVSVVHSIEATGNEEQLYETIEILADTRSPGADRGVAYVNERAWTADQSKLYVSKLIRPNIAVSWNTEDTNVITLPAALGTIQGMAGLAQRLVVVCSRGVAVVSGPGVDDTGAGQGWFVEVIDGAPGMGESTPRGVVATPAGVIYQGQDRDVWMVSPGAAAVPLSRPLRDAAPDVPSTEQLIDLINVPSRQTTNSMLMAQSSFGIRVLDLETGQWAVWNLQTNPNFGRYIAGINGALWAQLDTAPFVVSVDGPAGEDLGFDTTATIETGVLRPAHPVAHGWGRLRSVVLNESRLVGNAQPPIEVSMQVLADGNDRILMNKIRTTDPTDPNAFPGGTDGALEFRTSVQRCAHIRAILSITPAVFDVEGLDLWVSNTGEATPLANRS